MLGEIICLLLQTKPDLAYRPVPAVLGLCPAVPVRAYRRPRLLGQVGTVHLSCLMLLFAGLPTKNMNTRK